MILSSLFSFAQKPKYEIIHSEVEFYEFNSARDHIYIYTKGKLSFYDINENKLSVIDANCNAKTVRLVFPLFLAKTGLMYFVTDEYVYEIEEGQVLKKIPFIYDEYQSGAINAEWRKNEEHKMKVFNKLVADYKDNDIQKLMTEIYILNYKDGHSVAFERKRMKNRNLTNENKTKILKYVNQIELDTDTSFICKSSKGGLVNYFDTNKLVIKEKSYSCRKEHFMSLSSDCKYKISISFNNKTVKLKDTQRRPRYSYANSERVRVELNRYLPNSKYITDASGNVYILFWENNKHNLVSVSF